MHVARRCTAALILRMKLSRGVGVGMCLLAVSVFAADPVVRDIGVPVAGVNWLRVHNGATADGKPSALISFGQTNGGLSVADVDLATGHCTQYGPRNPRVSTFPISAIRTLRSGVLYIGSAWDGHLHRFDPAQPAKGLEDLGRIDADATFPTGIAEAPDGKLWIGTYPNAKLTCFDPATATFKRFGSMDASEQYLYPLVGDEGGVAALVKVGRPHIVVIDPVTGEHREAGPAITDVTDKTQRLNFFKGVDRRLYLDSHAGKFRVQGMMLVPADELPSPMAGVHSTSAHKYQAPLVMPGGWSAAMLDDDGAPRRLMLTNTDPLIASRVLTLDWKGGGSDLHVIELGPDGALYGSSYMPNRLFRVTTDGEKIADLGQHTFAMGEAYSVATLGGKVYLGSYPGSVLSVYDPARPIRFGTGATDNPRDLGRLDAVSNRPNAMITVPAATGERLWIGSGPDYGLYGGTLGWYDPKTGDKKMHRAIVADTSPAALLWLPELQQIFVGLSIEPGTGMKVKRLDGAFALWDPASDILVWSGDLGLDNLGDVVALAPAGKGLVYALIGRGDHIIEAGAPPIRPRLVLIDPAKRALVASAWLPEDYGTVSWHGLNTLRAAPDGSVYGATGYCIFRIKPGTCDVERIWQKAQAPTQALGIWRIGLDPEQIDVVGPIVGDQLYFATGWRLRALTLPKAP
jgi:hypothetical protein